MPPSIFINPLLLLRLIASRAPFLPAATYYSLEELRRHPNSIVILKTYWDILFAILLIAESSIQLNGHGSSIIDCQGFSFFFELLLIGSELCSLILVVDLYQALQNPFIDYKSRFRQYIAAVIVLAIIAASILVGTDAKGERGRLRNDKQ